MRTTSALDTALTQEVVNFFVGVRIDAAVGGVARLLDGGGEVVVAGDGTYVGADPTWGTLESLENISDGIDEQAPTLAMTLLPDASADVAAITSSAQQGSRTRIYLGCIDVNTRVSVASPYLMFDGVVDVPTLTFGEQARAVHFDLVSNFEMLFLDDEGARLSPSAHKAIWPGETGLDDVTGIVRQLLWGPGDPISGSAPGTVGGPITYPPPSSYPPGYQPPGQPGAGGTGGSYRSGTGQHPEMF